MDCKGEQERIRERELERLYWQKDKGLAEFLEESAQEENRVKI